MSLNESAEAISMAPNPNRTSSAESHEASPKESTTDGASKSSSEKAKQPSKLKQIWRKIGLDKGTCLIMAKQVYRDGICTKRWLTHVR